MRAQTDDANRQHRQFAPRGVTHSQTLTHKRTMFLLSSFISTVSSRFIPSKSLFISLSSTAAPAGRNWWADAVSHTEVTAHTYTCIDAEGVMLAGLHAQSQLPIMWLRLPASHPHDPIRSPDLSNQLLWQPASRRADRGSRALPIS